MASVDTINATKPINLMKGEGLDDYEVGDEMLDEENNDRHVAGEVKSVAEPESRLCSALWRLTML